MKQLLPISAVLLTFLCFACSQSTSDENLRPKVIVTTDINVDHGDPDDRQSLVHLFHYANEIDIRAIVVDWVKGRGDEAVDLALACYIEDYNNLKYRFQELGYPHPDTLRARVYTSYDEAIKVLAPEVEASVEPYYMAIWGNMGFMKSLLDVRPALSNKLRVLTIATTLRFPVKKDEYGLRNWNDTNGERMAIFNNPHFNDMWWVENDWGYNGMFEGKRPYEFLDTLATYGALGQHMKDCVWNQEWAHYFRAGDTPTIMYLTDNNNLDDPTAYNLGGCFTKPFPTTHPNFYMDYAPGQDWDYENPIACFDKAAAAYTLRVKEMVNRRNVMYDRYKAKLDHLYNK